LADDNLLGDSKIKEGDGLLNGHKRRKKDWDI
jgi:hypothetical protein